MGDLPRVGRPAAHGEGVDGQRAGAGAGGEDGVADQLQVALDEPVAVDAAAGDGEHEQRSAPGDGAIDRADRVCQVELGARDGAGRLAGELAAVAGEPVAGEIAGHCQTRNEFRLRVLAVVEDVHLVDLCGPDFPDDEFAVHGEVRSIPEL